MSGIAEEGGEARTLARRRRLQLGIVGGFGGNDPDGCIGGLWSSKEGHEYKYSRPLAGLQSHNNLLPNLREVGKRITSIGQHSHTMIYISDNVVGISSVLGILQIHF